MIPAHIGRWTGAAVTRTAAACARVYAIAKVNAGAATAAAVLHAAATAATTTFETAVSQTTGIAAAMTGDTPPWGADREPAAPTDTASEEAAAVNNPVVVLDAALPLHFLLSKWAADVGTMLILCFKKTASV